MRLNVECSKKSLKILCYALGRGVKHSVVCFGVKHSMLWCPKKYAMLYPTLRHSIVSKALIVTSSVKGIVGKFSLSARGFEGGGRFLGGLSLHLNHLIA